ncbi:hypothetical protein NHX12_013767 [Muraenolepis orangiensis]|uniref:UFSP1/2/DUB catalytic domain-containing protein n=1 Tax=Muraenolepis orangiensis TaxID=630683 RepID=A0A9Q0DAT3_9TELE|nr:hypothetical protein NHX12_013767 [Muraenolepis orangiensis]
MNDAIDWGTEPQTGSTTTGSLLQKNVHVGLPNPAGRCAVVRGDYLYYHYGCDGLDDRGWGCGYRTVQTMASWLGFNRGPPPPPASLPDIQKALVSMGDKADSMGFNRCPGGPPPPPSLPDIQKALVAMGDKPDSFAGSRGWIGTFEASLVLDYFCETPCRVVHVRGGELEEVAVPELHRHFSSSSGSSFSGSSSPVMMGGDRDNSSKGILGVCTGDQGSSMLLVVDPHYCGRTPSVSELHAQGWVGWVSVSSLDRSSFYNLCLPLPANTQLNGTQ